MTIKRDDVKSFLKSCLEELSLKKESKEGSIVTPSPKITLVIEGEMPEIQIKGGAKKR